MNEEFKIYGPILKLLCERLEMKHKQYGTSYLDRDYCWLMIRLKGELNELNGELFSIHLSGDSIIREALDVAICALLIGDKERRKNTFQIFLSALEERDTNRRCTNTLYHEDLTPF